VPRARGPERSRPPDLIAKDIDLLAREGFQEIVLTGIHLGRWGRDLSLDLHRLLEVLEGIPSNVRIRLSSIEPMDLTPNLVGDIISHPRICPHLHIPLQSADDNILRAMGRGHTAADFAELIHAAVETNPDVAIGTDIMVGFPGEGDTEFRNTLRFVSERPFAYLHVFTFSPREGTPAARMPDRPPGDLVKERMRLLKEVDRTRRSAFRTSFQGRTLPCLIESSRNAAGLLTALSHNYIRISIPAIDKGVRPGQVVPLLIDTINS
jgi:threonylcarbamoyladenosine tRNA methylthiotransferase MtaB